MNEDEPWKVVPRGVEIRFGFCWFCSSFRLLTFHKHVCVFYFLRIISFCYSNNTLPISKKTVCFYVYVYLILGFDLPCSTVLRCKPQ